MPFNRDPDNRPLSARLWKAVGPVLLIALNAVTYFLNGRHGQWLTWVWWVGFTVVVLSVTMILLGLTWRRRR